MLTHGGNPVQESYPGLSERETGAAAERLSEQASVLSLLKSAEFNEEQIQPLCHHVTVVL
jgi:hypothetical protein